MSLPILISEDESLEIAKKLNENGIEVDCSEPSKIAFLWRLFIKSETGHEASLVQIEQLRQQQSEEMKEVESYVEHIRNLSDEREALTVEFETENELLKQQIVKLQNQDHGSPNEEAVEMLQQQGLEEIAHGTTSEQIAYLLVERARLLDELEAEQSRNCVDTSEGPMTAEQLLEILEQERQDFEDELENQNELMSSLKLQIKNSEPSEVAALQEENNSLTSLLDQSRNEISKLELEIDKMQGSIDSQMKEALDSLKEDSNIFNASDEVKELQKTLDHLQRENELLKTKVESSNENLQSEKDDVQQIVLMKEKTIKRLQIEIEQQQKTIEDLERATADDARDDSAATAAAATQQAAFKSLKGEQDVILKEMDATMKALKLEKDNSSELESQVSNLQQEATTKRKTHDKTESEYRTKIKSLESKVKDLEEEVSTRERQHQLTEKEQKKVISNLRMEVEIEQGKFRQELKRKQHMEANFSEQRVLNAQAIMDLENINAEWKRQLEDYEVRVQHLSQENQQLSASMEQNQATLDKAECRMKDQDEKLDWLEKSNNMLAEENTQLRSQTGIESDRTDVSRTDEPEVADKAATSDDDGNDSNSCEEDGVKTGNQLKKEEFSKFKDLRNQNAVIKRQNSQLRERGVENKQLQETLDQQTEELENLQKKLTCANREILHYTQMEKNFEDLKDENEQLAAQLAKASKEVDALRKDLDSKADSSEDANELRSEITSLKHSHLAEITVLQKHLSQLTSENENMRSVAGERSRGKANDKINALESELSNVKVIHEQETRNLNDRYEQLNTDYRKLTSAAADKNHEIANLTLDVENYKKKLSKSEKRIVEEQTRHVELQNEMKILKAELKKKSQQCRDLESKMQSTQTNQAANLMQAETRVKEADRRIADLQSELRSTTSRLESLEIQTREMTILKNDLHVKDSEITSLKNQLTDEQINRSLASHTSDEITNQLVAFRDRERESQRKNNELQHMLLDVETRLEAMKEQTRAAAEARRSADEMKRSLQERISELEQHCERGKHDLFNAYQQLSNEQERYAERKCRTKYKLQQARALYNADKTKLRNEIDNLNDELDISKNRLHKELEWREHLENDHKKLLKDKRDLLTQLTENEENTRDQSRSLSLVQVKVNYLEEENHSLQQRVDSLTLQKHNLDRIVKEYQMERHREELCKQLSPDLASLISPRSHMHLLKTMSDDMEKQHEDSLQHDHI